jgi:hypothetical protein
VDSFRQKQRESVALIFEEQLNLPWQILFMMVWRLLPYLDKLTNISKSAIRMVRWEAAWEFVRDITALKHDSTDPLLTYLESSYQSRSLRLPFKVWQQQLHLQYLLGRSDLQVF